MSADSVLHEKAREAILAGSLPNSRPDGTWGGPGVGALCAICGVTVTRHEVEFEVEFTGDDRAGPSTYHLHRRCFTAWELERDNLERAGRATSPVHQAP